MSFDPEINLFAVSFAAALANIISVSCEAKPIALWVNEAIEKDATDPFTVLRVYQGPSPAAFTRWPQINIQIDTRGLYSIQVMSRASLLNEALLDANQHPQSNWTIPGKILTAGVLSADPAGDWFVPLLFIDNSPGLVGRDENKRWMASQNISVKFIRA